MRRFVTFFAGAALVGAGLFSVTSSTAGAGVTAPVTVNSLADDGGGTSCTLREAITAINNSASGDGCTWTTGADMIAFNIPDGGTITLGSSLPTITAAGITIEGSVTGVGITID